MPDLPAFPQAEFIVLDEVDTGPQYRYTEGKVARRENGGSQVLLLDSDDEAISLSSNADRDSDIVLLNEPAQPNPASHAQQTPVNAGLFEYLNEFDAFDPQLVLTGPLMPIAAEAPDPIQGIKDTPSTMVKPAGSQTTVNAEDGKPGTDPAEFYSQFQQKVLDFFPDLCLKHLQQCFDRRLALNDSLPSMSLEQISQFVITEILESNEYPKEPSLVKGRKRKLSETEDPEATELKKFTASDRPSLTRDEVQEIRRVFLAEFPSVPLVFIDQCIKSHKNLYPTYLALDHAVKTYDTEQSKYRKLKKLRSAPPTTSLPYEHLQAELEHARRKLERDQIIQKKIEEEAAADEELTRKAIAEGDFIECGCCFSDTPTAKSTHCSNDPCHFFCLECAKGNAKAQIELQRWKLPCMDGSGCQEEFSRTEKLKFLDKQSLTIIERLQQQEELYNAEIEGLEECPRCEYAEIYPSIEENRVFECKNDACGAEICRLCRKDSHVPKSCEEHQKDLGISERNAVAEAMSEALIRKCPKCSVAIIKEEGCNKMTCSKCGCYFCDVCKKDITREKYAHFTANGPCRQTDNHKARDDSKIKEAAQSVKARILAEHKDLTEEDLSIKFSEAVTKKPTWQEQQAAQANALRNAPAVNLQINQMARRQARRNRVAREAAAAAAAAAIPVGRPAAGVHDAPQVPGVHVHGQLYGQVAFTQPVNHVQPPNDFPVRPMWPMAPAARALNMPLFNAPGDLPDEQWIGHPTQLRPSILNEPLHHSHAYQNLQPPFPLEQQNVFNNLPPPPTLLNTAYETADFNIAGNMFEGWPVPAPMFGGPQGDYLGGGLGNHGFNYNRGYYNDGPFADLNNVMEEQNFAQEQAPPINFN